MWHIVKTKLYSNETKPIERIFYKNNLIIGSKKDSENLNEFFHEKVKNIIKDIPTSKTDPMKLFKKHIIKPNKNCKIKEVNYNNVKVFLSKLKNTNSASKDNITSRMLKLGQNSLIPLLLIMINSIIISNIFPNALKYSKIIPHYKNNLNKLDPKNLRPIHILSPLSKLIEKCFLNRQMHV